MQLRAPCDFRSPEQADADFGIRGPHTDIWGFAACVLHLASGRLPYQGLSLPQMITAMLKRRPPDVPATLPAWLQQALRQSLVFDTAARPSLEQLLQVGRLCKRCQSRTSNEYNTSVISDSSTYPCRRCHEIVDFSAEQACC